MISSAFIPGTFQTKINKPLKVIQFQTEYFENIEDYR